MSTQMCSKFSSGIALIALGICVATGSRDETRSDENVDNPGAAPIVVIPADFRVNDLEGRGHVLGSGIGGVECHGVAMIFLSTECPMCNQAIPKLNRLAAMYGRQGVEFFGVISDRTVTRDAARKHCDEYRIRFPMLLDSAGALCELTGATPHFFPAGTGRLLAKGGDVVFQVHYHPSGKPEVDQTEFGVCFAPASARQVITDLVVGNVDLIIPAGNANARFTAEYTLPTNVTLLEIRPHMHLPGKSDQVRGLLPTGSEVSLINIEKWDFNWQDSYVFERPIQLPAGSKIQVIVA